jgi:hypothetical protein
MKDFHGTYDCKTEKKTLPIPPIGFSMKVSRCRDVINHFDQLNIREDIQLRLITNVYSTGYGIGTVFPFALY